MCDFTCHATLCVDGSELPRHEQFGRDVPGAIASDAVDDARDHDAQIGLGADIVEL